MTLKENFKQYFINDEEYENFECAIEKVCVRYEQIADDYAIEFAYWCEWNNEKRAINTYEELLETFKKEKGL